MGRNRMIFYWDGIATTDRTPEEIEAELQRLKEESDKLTDWPPIY